MNLFNRQRNMLIFYGNPQPYVGSQFDLTCFHVDEILYYPEDPIETCFNTNVGIENRNKDFGILVYPNPTKGIINIRSINIKSNSFISLHTLEGNTIEIFPASQENSIGVLDLKPFQSGIYILKIQDNRGIQQVVKVIKQ